MNGHDCREASNGYICVIAALPDQTERALQELDELVADTRATCECKMPKNPIICALIRLLIASDGFGTGSDRS
jgi:hypothetical protein